MSENQSAIQPNTRYKWEPETTFTLNGTEFSQLYNTMDRIIASPVYQEELAKAQNTAAIGALYEIMKNKLSDAITSGIAEAVKEEATEIVTHVMD